MMTSLYRSSVAAMTLILLLAGALFWKTTGLHQVLEWQQAVADAPALLANNTELNKNQQRKVALALRTRLQSDPDYAQGWILLGNMQVNLGDHQNALAAFYHAWKLMPTDITATLDYSSSLIRSGSAFNINKAIDILTTLDGHNPENTKILSQLAYAALSKDDFPQATLWFRRILSQLPAQDQRRELIQQMITNLEQKNQTP